MTVREPPSGASIGAPAGPPQAAPREHAEEKGAPTFGLNLDSPVRGISLQLRGLQYVKPETIAPELRDFHGVRTVRDLLLAVESTQSRLSSLNIFSVLTSELHCGERDGDVCVTLHLKEERRRYNLGMNINGKGQAELEAAANIPAIAGSNKTLALSAATAPAGGASRVLSATLSAPRLPSFVQRGAPVFSRGIVQVFSSRRDMCSYISTATSATGAVAEIKAADGSHALASGVTLRDSTPLCGISRIASLSVMSLPWRSLKHSLRYTYTRDRLDQAASDEASASATSAAAPNVLLPRKGYRLQAAAEAALPGGDARFIKGEVHGFAAFPIPSSSSSKRSSSSCGSPWVFTARFGLGALLPANGASPLCLDDKFHFAGASSNLRGFRDYGVGPADKAYTLTNNRSICTPVHDHTGGDAFFASELCLAYDFHFPYGSSASSTSNNDSSSSNTKKRGFGGFHPRVFVFGSVGGLADVFQQQQQQTTAARLSALFREWRGSVGFGFSFPLHRGTWLEATMAVPVRRAETDEAERFQLGVRVTSVQLGQ